MSKKILVMALVAVAAVALSGSAHAEGSADSSEPGHKPEVRHIVTAGESLSIIADQYKLESWRPLWNANTNLTNPDLIDVGQDLIVPQNPVQDRPLPETSTPIVQASVNRVSAAPVARVSHSSAPANYAAGSGDIFARIRARESGGNYATNTGNGYYGAYQFDLGTWRGVGGTGLPSNASPAEQDARAAALFAARGCSPWPNTCR